jgi:hypothetical protein
MTSSRPYAGCGPAFGPIEVEVVRDDLVVSSEPEDDRGGA